MDRAGATLTEVAALLGSGQIQVLAQKIEQGGARINDHLVRAAVDTQCDRNMRTKFHMPPPRMNDWLRSQLSEA
jgi:hypothetical protein